MKAILHTAYGPPDELQLKEVETPVPGENEVRIKIHATTVTTSDCNIRNLTFVPKLFHLPMRMEFGFTEPKNNILGFDLAGEVEAVGKGVTRFKTGDQVFVATPRGQVRYTAWVTEDIIPGVIEANAGGGAPIARGAWRECNVNELTDPDNRDPISGFPVYKALLCDVVKA